MLHTILVERQAVEQEEAKAWALKIEQAKAKGLTGAACVAANAKLQEVEFKMSRCRRERERRLEAFRESASLQ
ncbi:MAG: hypothetical protein ACO3WU_13615, partial [Ilumatobacteraceae bacterium]